MGERSIVAEILLTVTADETHDRFSLQLHEGPYYSWPELTKLYSDGAETSASIPGYYINGQFAVGEWYLLITSFRCPFEEAADFVLLDQRLHVIGHEEIGAIYCSFLIDGIEVLAENQLMVKFGRDGDCRLEVKSTRPYLRCEIEPSDLAKFHATLM